MYIPSITASFALVLALAFDALSCAHAALYVNQPTDGSTCHAGQPCTVQWLDDGNAPVLSSIGPVSVGLFTGNQQIVQQINPVDVSTTHSLQFTPNSNAGPNSDSYYIAFTSISLNLNGSSPYTAFSPSFKLDGMSGSFASPVPSLTSTKSIPTSFTASQSAASGSQLSVSSTTFVGTKPASSSSATFPSFTPSTSSPRNATSSGFSTSSSPGVSSGIQSGTTTAPAASGSSSSTSSSNGAVSRHLVGFPLSLLLCAFSIPLVFGSL